MEREKERKKEGKRERGRGRYKPKEWKVRSAQREGGMCAAVSGPGGSTAQL